MRYAYRVAIDRADLGRRVTVRFRGPDGSVQDAVGILETHSNEGVGVRRRDGTLVEIRRTDMLAAKVVSSPPQPWRRNR
jgi:hypothetical protein